MFIKEQEIVLFGDKMISHSKQIERVMLEIGYSKPPTPFKNKIPLTELNANFIAKLDDHNKLIFKVKYVIETFTLNIGGLFLRDGELEKFNRFGFGGFSSLPFPFAISDCIIFLKINEDNQLTATIKRDKDKKLDDIIRTEEEFYNYIENNNTEEIECIKEV